MRFTELLPRETEPALREVVLPLLRDTEPEPVDPALRETVEPLRAAEDPVVRTEELAARVVPGAAERETLVRPVLERREPVTVLPVEAVLPPLRVRPLRLEEPPRETKLRVLRLASRWPTWCAWLLRCR